MSSTLYVMEAANLFAGNADPTASNHLRIMGLTLPTLEENYQDLVAGGAPVATEIETHINRLEAGFNLAGWQPEVMTLIGSSSRQSQIFTAYGVIKDLRTEERFEARAVMQGRLGRVKPSEYKRSEIHMHEYAIRAIRHYELYFGTRQIYFWDFFTSERVIGGEDQNAEINSILRVPTASGGGPTTTI